MHRAYIGIMVLGLCSVLHFTKYFTFDRLFWTLAKHWADVVLELLFN